MILLDLKMLQINGISLFHALKNKNEKAIICLITAADLSYLEQLKGKIPNIEKYVIHKPILLRNLKSKINELIYEKYSNAVHYKDNNSDIIQSSNIIF